MYANLSAILQLLTDEDFEHIKRKKQEQEEMTGVP